MDFKLFSCVIFLVVCWSSSSTACNSRAHAPDSGLGLRADKQALLVKFRAHLEGTWWYRLAASIDSFDDRMLLRFLMAADLDFVAASQSLQSHWVWRKYQRLDGILEEDWRDMEERFPYEVKVGAFPSLSNGAGGRVAVLHWYFGRWDLSYMVSSNEMKERAIRYAAGKMMEQADREAVSLTSTVPGSHSPKFHVIVDMIGLNSLVSNEVLATVEASAREWRHATELFLITNVSNAPDRVCRWSSQTKLRCSVEDSARDQMEL